MPCTHRPTPTAVVGGLPGTTPPVKTSAVTTSLVTTLLAAVLVVVSVVAAPVLRANGGTVRVSQHPSGPFLITVYTEPTPLRTGDIDVSVLLQDRETRATVRGAAVTVRARAVGHAGTGGTFSATREQATNKLFQSAKFAIRGPGLWRFTVTARSADGEGRVSFEAEATDPTLLDRPVLLTVLVLVPVLLVGWLLTRPDERREE